jgi:hypothetical protein
MKRRSLMIRKLLSLAVVGAVAVALFGCVPSVTVPKTIKEQSRKNVKESATWAKFDKSGQVKFLQVETTAPASKAGRGSKFDGSIGERLIEIKVDPAVKATAVEWSLTNKGKNTVWIVAAGMTDVSLPISIAAGTSMKLNATLDEEHYTYIVVDNEGGGTTIDIKANCGEIGANTARGKSMTVIWF